MLTVEHLKVSFGGVHAVEDVSFELNSGVVMGLIGPNGAGKSTTIEAVSGFAPASGSVRLDGVELLGRRPAFATENGLVRTFQQAQLWDGLSVQQNVKLPLRSAKERKSSAVTELMERLDLLPVMDHLAADLPYGTRRLVEVARAIACRPKVLLLDEPGAGLTEGERALLIELIDELRAEGVAILLVDHDMALVRAVSHHVTVMDAGCVIAAGSPDDVLQDQLVIETYLGV